MLLPRPSATAAKDMFSRASQPLTDCPELVQTAMTLAFWNHFFWFKAHSSTLLMWKFHAKAPPHTPPFAYEGLFLLISGFCLHLGGKNHKPIKLRLQKVKFMTT